MFATNKEQNNEEMKEQIKKMTVEDTIFSCRLCLLLIMLLELYFTVTWFIFEKSFTDIYELRYLICYSFLFSFSLVMYVLLNIFSKDKVNGYKKIRVIQTLGVIVIMLWSVLITIFDADHHTEFSYIVYATIVVLLPLVIYVDAIILNITYIACDLILIVFTFIISPDNLTSTVINFVVFSIVSLMACNLYHKTKFISIKRAVELQNIVGIDHLTGLFNRQKLNELSEEIIKHNCNDKTELSCVMMDIDDFKQINDNYGHLTGDSILKNIAEIVLKETPDNGVAFRYGGEEFLIVLSDFSSRQACNVVEKIQNQLKKGLPQFSGNVTLSFGVYTAVPEENDNIERYYATADDLLYTSKKKGKNCYTVIDKRTAQA